jgi:hypothetical protein
MDVAVPVLGVRGNRWDCFIGMSIAAFWDHTNLFVIDFIHAGLEESRGPLRTGHIAHPMLLVAVPAWTANLVPLVACLWGYLRQVPRPWTDVPRFAAAAVLSTGYFALIVALFQPRCLAIFPLCSIRI